MKAKVLKRIYPFRSVRDTRFSVTINIRNSTCCRWLHLHCQEIVHLFLISDDFIGVIDSDVKSIECLNNGSTVSVLCT